MRQGMLEDLAGRMYDAALDPSLWGSILSDLADTSGGNSACYMVSDVTTGASDVVLSRHVDPAVLEPFHAHYAAVNSLLLVDDLETYRAVYGPTMLRDEDWIERTTLEDTEYFNDFLRPIDACRGLFLRLQLQGRRLTSISISRKRAQEHFDDDDIASLGTLHRHAMRAVALGGRFADVARFAAGATAAIDAIEDPLLMLDVDRRVVHLNAPAERLLAAGTLLSGIFGRLTTVSSRLSAEFDNAVARALGPGARAGGSVMLVSPDGRQTARADVLPVGVDAALDAAHGPAVLIRIAVPDASASIDARLARLALTRAETALARLLLDGKTLREAAAARGVSFNTARRQLAGIFDKAGVQRQAELVRLLTAAS